MDELMIGQSISESESFSVYKSKDKISDGDGIDPDNLSRVFTGDESLGSRFFGWGVVRYLVSLGEQAVLLIPKDRQIKLPGGQDEDN